jgi:O-antigen/teichoic acid export membrane protein
MAKSAEYYFQDHEPSGELGRLALRGGVVSVVSGYGNGVLQLIAAIVLARLLTPDDFGLVAIITVLTSFAFILIDFGVGDATTQRSRITQSQVSSLFWLSSGIGFAIAAVLAACGPLIASLYRDPRLESVALYSAITFALSGMAGQHLSLLRRTMQFAAVAKVQFLSSLAGVLIGIVAAMCGFGYGALVLRQIVNAACLTAGAWINCPWRPGYPVFDSEVKSMVRFGMHVVGFSVVYSLARAADRIALGLYYRPSEVGFYQNAVTLYDYSIFQSLAQLHNVGSAALSKLQSDHAALRQKYKAALSALAFFAMPAAAILSVTAQDVVVILLGERWRAAGSLLSIIALRGIVQVIEGSQGWLHLSLGHPGRWRNWGIVTAIVQVVAILAGLPFGATGVATATVIASSLIAVPSITYAGRPAGIGAALVIRAVGAQSFGAIFTATAGWLLQTFALGQFSSLVRTLLSAGFCVSVYLLIVVGLFRLTEPIEIAVRLMRDHLPTSPLPGSIPALRRRHRCAPPKSEN